MKTVYKYQLNVADEQKVMLPDGAQILSVQEQDGGVCLWAMVDPTQEPRPRFIAIHGTGHPIEDGGKRHISTFQMLGGRLVFHAFEYFPGSGGVKHAE